MKSNPLIKKKEIPWEYGAITFTPGEFEKQIAFLERSFMGVPTHERDIAWNQIDAVHFVDNIIVNLKIIEERILVNEILLDLVVNK